ncbi:response regulator [Myxococcota bacterium]|nr:response regulator [Myxococcota bacterium]MBU1511003.1 response regulator [Myxococcota bacterium]
MDSSPIHILLVEDNPGDARLVRELVHEAPDLEIHHVQTLADGLAYLDQGCSDVVLLDLGLPDSSGMDTLRSFIGSAPSLPVVVLTGQNDEELGRLALREGAQDYLVKGMELEQVLTRAVRYAIERKHSQVQHDLLEEQLRASQKMEAIGSLAGGVAHDFNNLLSVILSYTGLAMDSLLEGDPLKDDLLEVQKAGERAAGLTRQLLAFSRKQVLQPSVLDVNEITSGLEKMLRRILGEDVELVQVLEPELGRVMADQGQLEQVLMNLVVNARDAMPAGGRLTIETSNIEVDGEYASRHMGLKTGPYVQIAVSDSGCGMDEAVRARIFEPFFTTKEKGKGTGLGLAMVYGIVQQSGGAIGVSSKPGHGTTFRIYLPRDVSGDAAPDLVPASPTRKTTGTETILVVEDEDALRKVIHRALSGGGYNVMTAAEGEEALRICARHAGEIHLLLTDVVMPKMSGRELAHALTADRPTTRVLYMSGYTGNTILHHGDFDAETQFLAKPFTMAGLMSKIRAVLD